MNSIKIIIADDHSLVVKGLQLLLQQVDWIEVIDIAGDGMELLDILGKKTPDLVLLDINMPGLNGLETARHIRQRYASIKLLILSTYNEEHLIEKAKQLGVNGYLLKNCEREDLLQSIRLVMNGQTTFPYRFQKEPVALGMEENGIKQYNLTKRETEIIQFLKNGFTNQQISATLYLSIYTVETHRKNIMQKLGLKKPIALMRFIIENKI